MTRLIQRSGPMFTGMWKDMELGTPFLQGWREVIGHEVNIGENLHFNVLVSTIMPPNCIALSTDYETAFIFINMPLNFRQKSILQTWQDTGKGTWKLITNGEPSAQHLMLQWPIPAATTGGVD